MKKWNQFKQQRMGEYASDTEKLIELANRIRKKYNFIVYREKILLFEFDTIRLVKYADSITREEFYSHIIHVPDLVFYHNSEIHIIEIDGWVHNDKQKVMVRDNARNIHYKTAGIPFFIINEQAVALKNNTYHSQKGATIQEIWEEIEERLDVSTEAPKE